MQTRSQTRLEQPSGQVAPPRVNSPLLRYNEVPLQISSGPSSSTTEVRSRRSVGGPVPGNSGRGCSQPQGAGGYYVEYRRGGRRKARIIPKSNEPSKICKCLKPNCGICSIFNLNPTVVNRFNNKIEHIINERNCTISCDTENVVYLLECSNCKIQYVGETCLPLQRRFSDHKSRIRKHTSKKKETFLIRHFNEGTCSGANYTCRVLQTIDKPARHSNGKVNWTTTRYRKQKEDEWMEKLHTIYPYGLNNRHGKNKDQEDEAETVVRTVFTKKRTKRKRGKRVRRRSTFIKGEEFYKGIIDVFDSSSCRDTELVNKAVIEVHKRIPQLRLSEVKKVGELALEDTRQENDVPLRLLHIILDLTRAKLYRKPKIEGEKGYLDNRIPFVVNYVNHAVDMINMNSIIHREEVKDSLPLSLLNDKEPMVVFKYDTTIRNKIFNYRDVADNFEAEYSKYTTCSCESSEFLDKDHGHVVTGDLRIIENTDLRALIRKGPNYREPKFINWKKTEESLQNDVTNFIKKWSDQSGLSEVCFQEWKNCILDLLKRKICRLKKNSKYIKRVSVLRKCSDDLKKLHEMFVMSPIDKASNNVGFICKKYYLQIIKNETDSDTYEEIVESVEEVSTHLRDESSNVGIPVSKSFCEVPLIHALIKMHKTPVKFRFIIGSRFGLIKPAAKTLVQILKLVMKSHRNYCNKILFYSGVQRYWIVENNDQVLKNMNELSDRRSARNIQMFDFSNMYTKIPQEDLKEKLKILVDMAFKGGTNQFIRVSKNSAHWNSSVEYGVYSKERIHDLIDFVVDNSYFRIGKKVFRQKIGIPMGVDPAPQMANLYLHYYESAYMKELSKTDFGKARKFNNTSRFIDDLSTLNNDGILSDEKEQIYPAALVLNKENADDQKGSFLDMAVNIVDKRFVTKIYDKRDDFDFEIVNYPDLSGNIPRRQAYGVYTSQILRYAKVCSEREDYEKSLRTLTGKLIRKGFRKNELENTLSRCYHKYPWIVKKYKL